MLHLLDLCTLRVLCWTTWCLIIIMCCLSHHLSLKKHHTTPASVVSCLLFIASVPLPFALRFDVNKSHLPTLKHCTLIHTSTCLMQPPNQKLCRSLHCLIRAAAVCTTRPPEKNIGVNKDRGWGHWVWGEGGRKEGRLGPEGGGCILNTYGGRGWVCVDSTHNLHTYSTL